MPGPILTLNAGSSSVKFALFDVSLTPLLHGDLGGIGTEPHFRARDPEGAVLADQAWPHGAELSLPDIFHIVLDFIDTRLDSSGLAVAGHRVVMGGVSHVEPTLVTETLKRDLRALTPLAPLHMPGNLAAMDAIAVARPGLAQVACFDTAFHATQPAVAQAFALPRAVTEAGVRRYGFHGLSYEFIAGQLHALSPTLAAGRVIAAHLGAGASLCAMAEGRSVASTMGFTALDGLMMATRCGTIDPGVILYLAGQGRSIGEIEDMLYRRSGLLGVSGVSGDVRDLLGSSDPHAAEALELFCYRIAIAAGGLASALGGLDGLVFTAGIGEHAPSVRADVCARLAWLGIVLDPVANVAGAAVISAPESRVEVRVVPTDEELMIARHTRDVLRAAG